MNSPRARLAFAFDRGCRHRRSAGSDRQAHKRREPRPRSLQPACGTARRRTFAASGRCATPPTSISKAILRKRASLPPGASSSIRPMGRFRTNREALAQRQENYRNRATADPSLKCYQAGVPRATYLPTPLQILQSPGNFAIVYQDNHAFRVFHPDTRPHFDARTGGWATRVIDGKETRWLPTSLR